MKLGVEVGEPGRLVEHMSTGTRGVCPEGLLAGRVLKRGVHQSRFP